MMIRTFLKSQYRVLIYSLILGFINITVNSLAEEPDIKDSSNVDFFNMEFLNDLEKGDQQSRQPIKYNIKLTKTDMSSSPQQDNSSSNIHYQIKVEQPQEKKEEIIHPNHQAQPLSPIPLKENALSSSPHEQDVKKEKNSALAPTNSPTSIMTDEVFELYPRDTHLIILPEPPIQIYLADPKIAEIQQTNATILHVQGLSPGHTEIIVTGKKSHNIYRYHVKVKTDYREIQDFIDRNYPNSNVIIHPLPNGLLIEGQISSSKAAEEVKTLAEKFFPEKGAVINRLQVKSNVQINLRVKIAEVDRTIINQLGINWDTISHYGHFRFGMLNGRIPFDSTTNLFNLSTSTDPVKSIGVRFIDPKNDIGSILDMLAQENLATVLAEPNLITSSGEEASFLVGGEFPYPISQGIGTAQTVTFQFKKYGISLSFLPIIMGETIVLRARPEVSDLDDSRTIKDQNGNLIPSIRTRRAESTMEMMNGQSMVMAGLLSDQTSSTINSYPWIGDIPILGALFRSNNFKNSKTELVIVVTPYLVSPIDTPTEVSLPTDGLKYANFFDMVWRQRINEPRIAESPDVSSLAGDIGFYY